MTQLLRCRGEPGRADRARDHRPVRNTLRQACRLRRPERLARAVADGRPEHRRPRRALRRAGPRRRSEPHRLPRLRPCAHDGTQIVSSRSQQQPHPKSRRPRTNPPRASPLWRPRARLSESDERRAGRSFAELMSQADRLEVGQPAGTNPTRSISPWAMPRLPPKPVTRAMCPQPSRSRNRRLRLRATPPPSEPRPSANNQYRCAMATPTAVRPVLGAMKAAAQLGRAQRLPRDRQGARRPYRRRTGNRGRACRRPPPRPEQSAHPRPASSSRRRKLGAAQATTAPIPPRSPARPAKP